ncbi:hypothetical protein ACFSZS_09995 [Seohaeicola zhoushanensis]
MDTAALLAQVGQGLLGGAIRVVDLSARLGPETPILKLPPSLPATPPGRDPPHQRI